MLIEQPLGPFMLRMATDLGELRTRTLADLNKNLFQDDGSYQPVDPQHHAATRRERLKRLVAVRDPEEWDIDW